MKDQLASAKALIEGARAIYFMHPTAIAVIDDLERRLDQPLRVALVGSVKAGKSTLLNGLLGERIAPTDARECTRIVTWYHHGTTPKVRGRLTNGEAISLPAKRQQDRLELDLQGLSPDNFERLDVTWPAPGIKGISLIDTPGIASISQNVSSQTNRFLLPEQGAAGADAVIYLLRSLHESDVSYIQAINERTRHGRAAIGSIIVLSRADELGSGRLTAMLSVNQAVERLRNHPELEGICETIVPVAGLMGMGAMSLRQSDFINFKYLAKLPQEVTQQLLVSAERFITAQQASLPEERVRVDLVDRFGMYGIRLAIAAIRGGISDANSLASELLRRSGLEELQRVISVHFTQRQSELKAHSIVLALHRLLRQYPVAGSESLLVLADDHMARAHTFTEMHLVGRIAGGKLKLPSETIEELERVIGGHGAAIRTRLGADPDTGVEQLRGLAVNSLRKWRELLDNPLLDRATFDACKVAERTCETMIVSLTKRMQERDANLVA